MTGHDGALFDVCSRHILFVSVVDFTEETHGTKMNWIKLKTAACVVSAALEDCRGKEADGFAQTTAVLDMMKRKPSKLYYMDCQEVKKRKALENICDCILTDSLLCVKRRKCTAYTEKLIPAISYVFAWNLICMALMSVFKV